MKMASFTEENHGRDASSLLQDFENFGDFRMRMGINVKISKNSDIIFARLPKALDPELLLHQTISIDTKTKLKLDNKKYTVTVSEDDSEALLILSKKLRRIQPICRLTFKKASKKSDQDKDLPEHTLDFESYKSENRHPFFGHDCEMDMTIDNDVSMKLEQASSVEKHKLKKMKKKKNKRKDDVKEEDELIYQMLQNSQVVKREGSLEDFSSKTKKKKKANGHINSTIVTGAQLPDFDPDISEIANNRGSSKKVKKEISETKKRKHESSDQESIISDILNSVKIELNETRHKKKKKTH